MTRFLTSDITTIPPKPSEGEVFEITKFRYAPCIEMEGHVENLEPEKAHLADFWSVYACFKTGGEACIADLSTKKQCEELIAMLEQVCPIYKKNDKRDTEPVSTRDLIYVMNQYCYENNTYESDVIFTYEKSFKLLLNEFNGEIMVHDIFTGGKRSLLKLSQVEKRAAYHAIYNKLLINAKV